MRPNTAVVRALRIRLRSVLIAIAFLGLLSAFILQSMRLKQAASREAVLRAALLREQAVSESNRQKALAAVDVLLTRVADGWLSAASGSDEARRNSLERALQFYKHIESNASEPEVKASAGERAKQIRSKLGDAADERELLEEL